MSFCARQGFEVIETVKILEKLSHIKTPISLSIIGCVVNGPGEALTDVGITGGKKEIICFIYLEYSLKKF